MKKLLLILFLLSSSFILSAQPFGNEWINYSQKYYYVKVVQTGVYRIDYNALFNAGIPVSSVNPKNFQVFGREQELFIHVEGEQDNSFDPGDYIEFYAEKNDGKLDTILYNGEANMADTYYSLYNDTLRYYFTWNNDTLNRRMVIETDVDFSSYTPVDYVWKTFYTKFTDDYRMGEYQDGSSSSLYTAGEGWFAEPNNGVGGGYSQVINVLSPNVYSGPGAPDATIKIAFTSASDAATTGPGNHRAGFNYGSTFSNIVLDTIFTGYKLIKYQFTYPNNEVSYPASYFQFNIIDNVGAVTDFQAFGSITIRYPHRLTFDYLPNLDFYVRAHPTESKSRLDILNYSFNNPRLYCISDTVKRIPVSGVPNNYQALVPNHYAGEDQFVFFTNESSIQTISSLIPVNGNGSFTDFTASPVDSLYIILTHVSLLNEAGQYAMYRSSPAGGGYNTLVVDVEQLYDQYGSGIQKHALALRRFCADMISSMPIPPSNLLLLGKGIREANEGGGFVSGSRKDPVSFKDNLIPSFGYPSSDVLITSGINGNIFTPEIPTGRVAAINGNQVLDYLNKVIEYEAAQQAPVYTHEDKLWMKHILHFGGGANQNEQVAFGGYLDDFAAIAEDTLFGGYTNLYLKQTSSPINPVDFSEISEFLEEGVTLMTFFGHASSDGFDQNIDDPINWNNQGKYPFLLGNGCYAGDIYQPTSISNSEEFVLFPQRGTIGFLSTVKVGFAGPLYIYSREYYKQFSYKNYKGTVGQHSKNTIQFMENFPGSFLDDNVAMQMALHGDPAISINSHDAPEFVVRNQDIFFDPPVVSLGSDSVNVNVVVYNLGKTTSDSVLVELIRHFPNNNGDSVYLKFISARKYIDTVVYRIPVLHNLATGINVFDVAVDIPSNIIEVYDEISNNQATATLFINSNGVATIYPYEYAIVPDSLLTFKASTLNPLAQARNYRIEIDTTDLFNSPFKKYNLVNSPGGVVEFECADFLNATTSLSDPLIFTDSTVYFWRVSPDSTIFVWDESSFQYIHGQTGWGQAHFFQFKNNTHQSVNYDRPSRSWVWDETYRILEASLYVASTSTPQWYATEWNLDGALQDYSGCGDPSGSPSIHVAVVDPLALEAWGTYNCAPGSGYCGSCNMQNSDNQFGNANNDCGSCRGRVEKYFVFRQYDPVSMDSLMSMYTNHIPAGHYVLFYTFNYADYSLWQPNYYSFFQSIGADSIQQGNPNDGWIYLTQKGNETNFSNFVSGTNPSQYIQLRDTLRSLDYQGKMISEIAGPAAEWNALYWEQEAKENPTYDSTQLTVIGIKNNGAEDLLISTTFTSLDSIINLNTIIDASVYPRLRLEAFLFDDQLFTPAQVQRWQLLYQPLPEAAVNPQLGFYFNVLNDSIYEGEDFELAVAIENISPYDMDSLLIHYWVEDEDRVLNYINYPRQDSLLAGQFLYDTVHISSEGFSGLNSIWLEVNPVPLTSVVPVYDQLEQYHFNNYMQIPFYVIADEMNPILDVTFDGIHILNGDIVSGKPDINITLKDENPYLIMNETRDTAHFAVYLTDPSGNQKRVWFMNGGNTIMEFTPSTGPNDKFKIHYNPELTLDGKYRLLVQASDKSGNESGDFDFEIDFEVINHSTITEVMNYPNPFSTKTHFVFTLTGSVIPDFMKIQIMTVSGKIVREIMVDELGPIRIGRNITEYAWDGRDEFGDQLANGVYLYRVIAKINGESIEKRESGADAYFNKGFGKMVLMR